MLLAARHHRSTPCVYGRVPQCRSPARYPYAIHTTRMTRPVSPLLLATTLSLPTICSPQPLAASHITDHFGALTASSQSTSRRCQARILQPGRSHPPARWAQAASSRCLRASASFNGLLQEASRRSADCKSVCGVLKHCVAPALQNRGCHCGPVVHHLLQRPDLATPCSSISTTARRRAHPLLRLCAGVTYTHRKPSFLTTSASSPSIFPLTTFLIASPSLPAPLATSRTRCAPRPRLIWRSHGSRPCKTISPGCRASPNSGFPALAPPSSHLGGPSSCLPPERPSSDKPKHAFYAGTSVPTYDPPPAATHPNFRATRAATQSLRAAPFHARRPRGRRSEPRAQRPARHVLSQLPHATLD